MNDEQNKNVEPIVNETPDETGSFAIESHIKIFDPETQEVFVNQR